MDNKLARYILKHNCKRNNRLKYDFMPSLLEIVERPSHIAGAVIVASIAVILVVAIIWASLSELDIVVLGAGSVVPDGRIVDIQPLIGGKVEAINVKEGDYVNSDDVLFSIENNTVAMDLAQLERDIEWCKIRQEIAEERLKNSGYEINFEEYDAKFFFGLKELALEIDIYKEQEIQQQKNLDIAKDELEKAENEVNEYLIASLRNRVELLEANIASSMKQYESQIYSQLFNLDREMDGYIAQQTKLKISSEAFVVRAPVNGYVNMISVTSAGQTVNTGSPSASIVPVDSPLIMDCFVLDRDRDEIEVEMEAIVKLVAYPFSEYGEVRGKILYISPSAFSTEDHGNVYDVKIEIDSALLSPKINLVPGLTGNVEILIGKRTIMQYFLDPIIGTIKDSMKEN